jgi:hypothetical protein
VRTLNELIARVPSGGGEATTARSHDHVVVSIVIVLGAETAVPTRSTVSPVHST